MLFLVLSGNNGIGRLSYKPNFVDAASSETLSLESIIAANQHVSPRTLIRRLKRAGTSYQAILKEVLKTLSLDYLLKSDLTRSS